MPAPTRKKIFDIVGEAQSAADGTPRQELLVCAEPGDPIDLQRQPDNAYDTNAIAVLWEGRDIGYLSKKDAETLAPALDDGQAYSAQIHELKGGVKGYASYGARISVSWDGKSLPAFKALDDSQEKSRKGKLAAMRRERTDSGTFKGAAGGQNEAGQGCLGAMAVLLLFPLASAYAIWSLPF